MKYRTLALVAAMLALMACSSKDKKAEKPAELVDIQNPTVRVQKLWGASVGGGGKKLRLGLGLVAMDGRLFAAGREGDVAAYDLRTGKPLWRVDTKLELAGGTGAGHGHVAVGSADGQVLLLSAEDGAEKWRANVKGEVLSAPAIAESAVIVRTVDGKLHALTLADGAEAWTAEQQIPRLTLRGTAAPVVVRDIALSGFDNGRVLAVSINDGATVWDSPVSPPHGRTELERLNDIDAAVKVVGEDVFVAGFQGRAAMLSLESGQIWWTRDVSSYRGVEVDDDQMYVSASDGSLVALNRRTGVELWRNDSLQRRSLSAPVAVGEHVVVADLDGYVHFFDRATGVVAGRAKTSGARVTNAPVTVDGIVYVISDKGDISALRGMPIEARAARRSAPAQAAPAEAAPAEAEPASPPGG
jgi:outer membrane protein assembly factor BamB